MAEVENAARIAHAHDFIMETEKGYENNVGESGTKLSGGQKQRISIARAVMANPPILILDEATSALDTESERFVQDAMEKLLKNRTSIVIAHRLSTIQNANFIIVVEEGRIVETGTHSELIGIENGTYRKLHSFQSL
jgi:subfamily B ATP-binding cassette protein MsbA